MKIFNEKDILTYADLDKAKEYIGKKGYFGYKFKDIQLDLNKNIKPEQLTDIDSTCCIPFKNKEYAGGFFLPEDKVIEDNPIILLRPFNSFNEFINYTKINLTKFVWFRDKKSKIETSAMIVGYQDDEKKPAESLVSLGGRWFSYQILFDNAEILLNDEWKMFGVKE